VSRVRTSVEKAKGIVDQFKSLTRAQEITPVTTHLRPILEDACKTAQAQGVACEIGCEPDVTVKADPERLAECFDELAFNSTHWFDKPTKRIEVNVTQPTAEQLPPSVDSSQRYQLIQFKDNGAGIPLDKKDKIFDAFYTTRDHGTGLGLALVRRIIEGHGGAILETGIPGKGAEFEIYLPRAEDPAADSSVSVREPASKKKAASTKKRQSAKRKTKARQSVKKG
jgi:signal transduction histidine kinase